MESFYKDMYIKKIESIDENSKLFMYKSLKPSLECKFYLKSKNFEFRKLITKFRISNHCLLIEKGRYLKIPRENRICQNCNVIEDEKHFLLECNKYFAPRQTYIEKVKTGKESINFDNMNENEKIKYILSPSTFQQVENTGAFLKQSLALRTGDL